MPKNQLPSPFKEFSAASADMITAKWDGNIDLLHHLEAAWIADDSRPLGMTPALTGGSGCGKGTLARACARERLGLRTWSLTASSTTEPYELFYEILLPIKGKPRFRASAMLTAMLWGGALILEEAQRLSDKSWAALRPLLEGENTLDLPGLDLKVKIHPDFRWVCLVNDSALFFQLPEFVFSRMAPRIDVEIPSKESLLLLLRRQIPDAPEDLAKYIAAYINDSPDLLNLTHGVNMLRMAVRLLKSGNTSNFHEAARRSLDLISGKKQPPKQPGLEHKNSTL